MNCQEMQWCNLWWWWDDGGWPYVWNLREGELNPARYVIADPQDTVKCSGAASVLPVGDLDPGVNSHRQPVYFEDS